MPEPAAKIRPGTVVAVTIGVLAVIGVRVADSISQINPGDLVTAAVALGGVLLAVTAAAIAAGRRRRARPNVAKQPRRWRDPRARTLHATSWMLLAPALATVGFGAAALAGSGSLVTLHLNLAAATALAAAGSLACRHIAQVLEARTAARLAEAQATRPAPAVEVEVLPDLPTPPAPERVQVLQPVEATGLRPLRPELATQRVQPAQPAPVARPYVTSDHAP